MNTPSPDTRAPFLWKDGKVVSWDDASLDPGIHALHYGTGVFEGVRCFEKQDGTTGCFNLPKHFERLARSAAMSGMTMDFSTNELCEGVAELIKANDLKNAYLRPLSIQSDGYEKMARASSDTNTYIMAFHMPALESDEIAVQNAAVSPFIKPKANAQLYHAKNTGHYILVSAAARDAVSKGFNQAIFLDEFQNVAEALTDNVFVVSGGQVLTPPDDAPILCGLTRQTVCDLLLADRYTVKKQDISLSQLLSADEIFTTSTAGRVKAVGKVGDTVVSGGAAGAVTQRASALLNTHVFKTINGE